MGSCVVLDMAVGLFDFIRSGRSIGCIGGAYQIMSLNFELENVDRRVTCNILMDQRYCFV
jgi:hypothetical protein